MADSDEKTLDELYELTVSRHRDYLVRLQTAFNNHCDEIALKTEAQLKNVPENDSESRKEIYAAQKKELDEALTGLKKEISSTLQKMRKKLEEINQQKENMKINELESMLQNLSNDK